jgi:hypothetical protein
MVSSSTGRMDVDAESSASAIRPGEFGRCDANTSKVTRHVLHQVPLPWIFKINQAVRFRPDLSLLQSWTAKIWRGCLSLSPYLHLRVRHRRTARGPPSYAKLSLSRLFHLANLLSLFPFLSLPSPLPFACLNRNISLPSVRHEWPWPCRALLQEELFLRWRTLRR